MCVDDLKSFLAGRWHVSRRISNHRVSVSGRFSGEAAFSPIDGGLRYDERGMLVFGAYRLPASRAYVFVFDSPRRADVWFDGGGYFHPLELVDGRSRVRHVCADDIYDGAFRVLRDDAWTAVWRVNGPGKDHVLRTRYHRMEGEAITVWKGKRGEPRQPTRNRVPCDRR